MSDQEVNPQAMLLELIAFIAESGAEFVAKRVHCEDPTCELDHLCARSEGGKDCGKDAVWLVLLPSDAGVLDIELCAEHAALLLLTADEGMRPLGE